MDPSARKLARAFLIVSALTSIACTGGCVTRVGDFSLLSTGTPQYERMDRAHITPGVKATDGRVWVLFFPFDRPPSIEAVVNKCQNTAQGDFMEKVRVERLWWTFVFVSYDQYTCIGDVGDTKRTQGVPIKRGKSAAGASRRSGR